MFFLSAAHVYSRRIFSVCACLLLLTVNACRRDKFDQSPPVIAFEQPVLGESFFYDAAIPVKAIVNDDRELVSIRIQVTNAANQSYLSEIHYQNAGSSKNIDVIIFNSNLYLTSGTYFVKITANDGENESVAFREIQLFEAPKILHRVYGISQPSSNVMLIDSINTGGFQSFLSFNTNYGKGNLNSRNTNCVVANSDNGNIHMLEFPELISQSNWPGNTTLSNYFSSSSYDETKFEFFVGSVDGKVWKMSGAGQINLAISQINNAAVKLIELTTNFIYTYTSSTSGLRYINVYHRNTGSLFHSLQVFYDIKGMKMLEDEDHILVVGNNVTSKFEIYNNQTNALNGVFNFYNPQPVSGLWPGSQGNFYVHHTDGITYYTNNLENFSVGLNILPEEIKYEPLSNKTYVIAADGLHLLNAQASAEFIFLPQPNLKDIWFHYNK